MSVFTLALSAFLRYNYILNKKDWKQKMPCRDYDFPYEHAQPDPLIQQIQLQNDKLARIACKAMRKLQQINQPLKDVEAETWFVKHEIADAKAENAKKLASFRAKLASMNDIETLALAARLDIDTILDRIHAKTKDQHEDT